MTTKENNLLIWNNLKQVPPACLKTIGAGRMKGMSNISPQWRLQAMTNQFGICGIGWKYEITNKWIEDGSDGQKIAFVDISLFIKVDNQWSDSIPGTGGSMLISKEKSGLYTSDEAYKMALTDALSVAMKSIGVASDIYIGNFDGVKYVGDTSTATNDPIQFITNEQIEEIKELITKSKSDENKLKEYFNIKNIEDITADKYQSIKTILEAKNENS